MTAEYLLHGVAQEAAYEVLPVGDDTYYVHTAPGVETRRYADGKIAVFGPAVPYIHSVALKSLHELDDIWFDELSDLPEPVQAARDAALTALQALADTCDSHASAS